MLISKADKEEQSSERASRLLEKGAAFAATLGAVGWRRLRIRISVGAYVPTEAATGSLVYFLRAASKGGS